MGAPKLVLYGLSYGTYLMPVYADRHPERVESMVLSGAFPLAFDTLARPGAQQVSLTLRRICERSGACDPDTAVRDLVTSTGRLRTRPLVLTASLGGTPRTVVFGEDKLADLMYEPATAWPRSRNARAARQAARRPSRPRRRRRRTADRPGA